jgi:nonribosomal peptide synthetase DhbF
MAADYVTLIRQIQPVGPYNLLGWSFGGLVAHAMATQLQHAGQEVGLLALLDSFPVDSENLLRSRDDERQVEDFFAGLGDKPLRDLSEALRREGHILTPQQYQTILDTNIEHLQLAMKFSPQRFAGNVLFFVSTDGVSKQPIERWAPYVTGVIKVHQIDCAHRAMIDALPAAKIGSVLAAELAGEPPLDVLLNRSEQSMAHASSD